MTRDQELHQIMYRMMQSKRPLWLKITTGPGGIGKRIVFNIYVYQYWEKILITDDFTDIYPTTLQPIVNTDFSVYNKISDVNYYVSFLNGLVYHPNES